MELEDRVTYDSSWLRELRRSLRSGGASSSATIRVCVELNYADLAIGLDIGAFHLRKLRNSLLPKMPHHFLRRDKFLSEVFPDHRAISHKQ